MEYWSAREKKLFVISGMLILLLLSSWAYYFFAGEEDKEPPLPAGADVMLDVEKGQLTVENETEEKDAEKKQVKKPEMIVIDVKGAVKKPGVIEIEKDARVHEAVRIAGGFTDEADQNQINQAAKLNDGMVLYIPEKGEEIPAEFQTGNPSLGSGEASGGKININTATAEQLQSLNGIGPAKAQDIVRYRETHGGFERAEELLNVSGIGEKTLQRLRSSIIVK